MGLNKRVLRSTVGMGVIALSVVVALIHPQPSRAAQPRSISSHQALILLRSNADIDSVIKTVEMAGGRVIHVFPPSAFIANLPAEGALSPGILDIYTQKVNPATLKALPDHSRRAVRVWNALLDPPAPTDTSHSLGAIDAELSGSAMIPPPPESRLALVQSGDPTPGYGETSEFFIGRVAVGIVLPESDGSVDESTEDWSEDERALVLSEITAALDWWAALEPNARLTFVYDDGTAAPVNTSYEPIGRPYGDQSLWITEVMETKGYTATSYFDRVRNYNNDLREIYDTDWAFTIFVVDSSNDADNRFVDGYFAYAYLGGPFMVMTFGNNGYGPHDMDAVAAHEVGHIFWALDQYYAAHQPCERQSGYLGVENQNSQYGDCVSDGPSIMRGQTWPYHSGAIDEYARGQIGWRDSDSDGIFDPIDTTLSLTSAQIVTDTAQPNVLAVTGGVRDVAYPSPFHRDVTINFIERVEYRVDQGEWTDAQPVDGDFDTYEEGFTFITSPLPTGEANIKLRVTDSAGNALTQTLTTVFVVDPVDDILNTTMTRLAQQAEGDGSTSLIYNGQSNSDASFIAEMYYRIDDNAWQPLAPADGAFDESREEFTLTIDLTGLPTGEHRVEAYAVDGEGNAETSPASDIVFVGSQGWSMFLPISHVAYTSARDLEP